MNFPSAGERIGFERFGDGARGKRRSKGEGRDGERT